MQNNEIFLKLLQKKALICDQKLEELVQINNNNAFDILLSLIKQIPEEKNTLGKLWGDSLNIAYTNLDKIHLNEEIVKKIPEEICKKNNLIPLYQFGNVLTIAISNPLNEIAINTVEKHVGLLVSPVFSFPDAINKCLKIIYKDNDSLEMLASKYFVSGKQQTNENSSIQSDTHESLISDETKNYLVNNLKNIVATCQENKVPDKKICTDTSEKITKEINDKYHLVKCVNQFRITDEYSYSHSINVAMLSAVMGKTIGLSDTCIKELTLAALLHDIGKIKIPKEILYKPDILTNEEQNLVRNHTEWGYQIVRNYMRLPDQISDVVRNHHERSDGNGYNRGLKAHELSLYTQIVSIVDVYDALISDKSYKNAISQDKAINIMLLEGHVPFNFDLMYKFVVLIYKNEFKNLKENFKKVVYS